MALADEIKKRMFTAMKQGKTVEKEILRVALGEIQTAASRTDSDTLNEADVQAILKKLVKSNREALAATSDPETRQTLEEEIAIVEGLLPKTLSVDEIVSELGDVAADIKAAPAAGPAMGVAMKTLKQKGLAVNAPDVNQAIAKIRS